MGEERSKTLTVPDLRAPGRLRGPVPWARVLFGLALVAGLVTVFIILSAMLLLSAYRVDSLLVRRQATRA